MSPSKLLLSILTVLFFLGHLWFVYTHDDPCCLSAERKDIEGLTWTAAYLLSLTIYILARYHQKPVDLPLSFYYLSLFCGLLLLIWDFFYYIRKDYFSSFLIYSLLVLLFVVLLFHTLHYSGAMALVQLPILLRTLFLYVGDCDKLFL